MAAHDIPTMKKAHKLVAEIPFEVTPLSRGYADRYLRIDLSRNTIEFRPVTQQMKDLWVGGKGLDLWLMFQEITGETRWDSPENAICMSPGPLAGTTSFPGAGKTLVTSLSPMTGSVMDCNVGGFFGPYFKFCGLDAIVIVGRAPEETLIVIDAPRGRITLERAPLESIDAHLVAEELTEMYADDELDRKNVSVVCAGRAATHARMGVLNFSFYDWRKRTARIKQAGRGGIGTVFRHKKLKALVVKNRGINPAWSVAESPVAKRVSPKRLIEVKDAGGKAALREIIHETWRGDPEHVIDMLRDIQARFGCVPRTALDEITLATCTPTAYLYHIVTFMDGFTLEPHGTLPIRVCTGAACRLNGAGAVLAAFEQALGIRAGETTPDGRYALAAGPCLGACGAAPVVQIGGRYFGEVAPGDVKALLAEAPAGTKARPLSAAELEQVAAEQSAYAGRARSLLAICTGKRTPAGSAKAAKEEAEDSGAARGAPAKGSARRVFLCGQISRPGEVEIPAGTTLREVIERHGGGLPAGKAFKALQAGGPSGSFLTAADLDRPVDFAKLATSGSMTGPERAVVLAEDACMVGVARDTAAFLAGESCGKCTPCREGLRLCASALERLARGEGRPEDLTLIEETCETMREASFCQFGVWAANPLLSALAGFRTEFEAHARGERCR